MGAPEPLVSSGDLAAVSDEELVRRYCMDRRNDDPLSEVWRRHEKRVDRVVRRTIFPSRFCPPGWSPQSFADSAFSRAQLYFFRRLCSFLEFRGSFTFWVSILTKSSVFDEYDYLKKFREITETALLDSDREADADESERRDKEEFRSQNLKGCWWLKPLPQQDAPVVAQERKAIVASLLITHAQQSDDDLDSAQTIRLRYWRDWTLAQCGARVYGVPFSNREKNRQEQAVHRLLSDNYEKLRTLLKENFGITEFRHI